MNDISAWVMAWCDAQEHRADDGVAHGWLQQLAAESLGWQPVGDDCYLHVGASLDAPVIEVIGVVTDARAEMNAVLING